MNIKIKHIAHINLARGFRGGERQTALLIAELSKLGYKQTLFYKKGETSLKDYIKKLEVQNLDFVPIFKPYFFNIYKFLNIDLIHAHEAKAYQLAYLIYKIYNIPYVITRRVQNLPSNNFFNNLIYKNAKKVVAISEIIKNDLLKIFNNLNIIKIASAYSSELKNEVDLNSDEIEEFKKINGKKIVGHIGAIVDNHKGTCTILETAKLLEQIRKDIYFIIIGDGIDLSLCQARSRYLSNISFFGFREEPQRFINKFNVFIFPSNHEGLGSTLLDVMRYGKPIIASAVGGIPDLIENNKNGYLIEPKNPEMLKNKILKLIDNNDDVKNFGLENKVRAENYSPEKMAEKYINVYNEVLT